MGREIRPPCNVPPSHALSGPFPHLVELGSYSSRYQETWLACNSVLSQKRPRTLPPTLNGAVLCSTVLLLLLLFLLAGASFLSLIDPLWLWTSGYTRSLHLQLKHINGPPPT